MIINTRSNILNLISTNSLIPGELYRISDAYNCTLQAISDSKLLSKGYAIFLVPDYNNYPLWRSGSTFSINDISIWNGLHFQNLTGTNTSTTPDLDTTNWNLLTPNLGFGYLESVDEVKYDIDSNLFYYRKDNQLNCFDLTLDYASSYSPSPIDEFQWGSPGVFNNQVTESRLLCINQSYLVIGNVLFSDALLDATLNEGSIYNNDVRYSSQILAKNNKGIIANNLSQTPVSILDFSFNEGVFDDNRCFNGPMTCNNQSSTGETRSFTIFNGASVDAPYNEGLMGAIHLDIGATLKAANNSGVIKWSKFSQTTVADCDNNQGTIQRVEQKGPFTNQMSLNSGVLANFLQMNLKYDKVTDPSNDTEYQFYT